ncbi:MAG: NAD-dependent epimerase [Flavobacterium psychrophilum]|nr:MAG: NAD-dependent epimerase [Flavobacterium psychrophilum]
MILVTGGTGLVGAHLLLELAGSGQKVRALYRTQESLAKTKNLFTLNSNPHFEAIEWVVGDITDIPSLEEAFIGIDTVYHCAACVSFEPKDEELLRKVNIEGTANMVNCSLDFGVKKFCHVSSIAALGDPKENELITEETEWNPEVRHSDYAISKYGAEMEVWRAWQEGLNVVIVNPGIIFGKGFWDSGSGKIFSSVKKGQPFYTTGSCGIVAAEDVIKAMLQLMASDTNGERYTLIAENISYKEILDTIANGLKAKHPSIHATPAITSIGWRIDWFLSKLIRQKRRLTQSMARSSHNHEEYSNSKIKEKLDFTFVPPSLFLKQLSEDYRALPEAKS